MSKSKTTTKPAPKYERERLLKSKALAAYQRDFAAAVLTEKEYTIKEAKAAIEAALRKGAS